MLRFNSTTVQLILARTLAQAPIQRFQFHNGTINTDTLPLKKHTYTQFQFHNGTINTTTKKIRNDYKTHVSIPQRYN